MNDANHTPEAIEPASPEASSPSISRSQMQQDVVAVLRAQLHLLSRVFGREPDGTKRLTSDSTIFSLMSEWSIEGDPSAAFELPGGEFAISWSHVANTHLAKTMEALYDYAFFATFDPLYYPQELGDESGAWWVALYLKDMASSNSLLWHSEYTRLNEDEAARRLLRVAEIANARNLLEGAQETFIQGSEIGFLTIRQLALVSGFKEESLRVLANPKRKNPLPTQSHNGVTVVAADDARTWLQSKGRYLPVTPQRSSDGSMDLATVRFNSPQELADALSSHVDFLARQGAEAKATLATVKALYPSAFWERTGGGDSMVAVGLALQQGDLQDAPRMRELALAFGWSPELLTLRAAEAATRASLVDIERRIRLQTNSP